jgi:hypothetical protein
MSEHHKEKIRVIIKEMSNNKTANDLNKITVALEKASS